MLNLDTNTARKLVTMTQWNLFKMSYVSLGCCSPWSCTETDMPERLNNSVVK